MHDLDKSFESAKNSLPAMDRLEYLTMPDYGLSNKDIKYFHIDSVVSGRGPNRLRYLDLEGTAFFFFLSSVFQSSRTPIFRSMGPKRKEHSLHICGLQPLGANEPGAGRVPRKKHT